MKHILKSRVNWSFNPLIRDDDYVERIIEGVNEVCSMANQVGKLTKDITIFTTNGEDWGSHLPHIHVCKLDEKNKIPSDSWLKHRLPYKNLFTIRLRADGEKYTLENVEFEKVWVEDEAVLRKVIKWLNTWITEGERRNADKALDYYLDNNTGHLRDFKPYREWIKKVNNKTAYHKTESALINEVLSEYRKNRK